MSEVVIFTDSTCDLSNEIISNNNIIVIPLYVTFEEEIYKDGIQINTKELYEKINTTKTLPKTSAPSPLDYINFFKPYIDNDKEIIYIGLSSKLSSTLNNAKLALLEFENRKIEIVDSLNLSTGIGLLVMKAVDYKNQGLNAKEIGEKIRELVPKVQTSFVIDTLDYIYKGGRCSAIENFVGGVLKIRPIVKVVSGSMILGEKIRGKRNKALNVLLQNTFKDKDYIHNDRLMITHSMSYDDAYFLKEELAKQLSVKEIIITEAGCVISSHCGPKTVGILYIKD